MAKVSTETLVEKKPGQKYRIRRKSDGHFFGNRRWGQSHGRNGKFYATPAQACAAFAAAQLQPHEMLGHELIAYEMKEVAKSDLRVNI